MNEPNARRRRVLENLAAALNECFDAAVEKSTRAAEGARTAAEGAQKASEEALAVATEARQVATEARQIATEARQVGARQIFEIVGMGWDMAGFLSAYDTGRQESPSCPHRRSTRR